MALDQTVLVRRERLPPVSFARASNEGLRSERASQVLVEKRVHRRIVQLVPLSQAASQVDHGLDGHPAFDGLVAAVELGKGFLYQRHPKFVGVETTSVNVVPIRLHWQSVVDQYGLPFAIPIPMRNIYFYFLSCIFFAD